MMPGSPAGRSAYRVAAARRSRATPPRIGNGFEESMGLVEYYLVVAWDCLNEKRAIIQPLANKARADWAVGVLAGVYPDRAYSILKGNGKPGTTIEQMEAAEAPVIEDLGRLEIAQRLGMDWYD